MSQEIPGKTAAREKADKFLTKPLLIIYLTVFIDLIGFGIVIPLLPYYSESPTFRATPFEVEMIFAVYSAMQFIFAPVLGGLSDRYGRRPVLFLSIIGSGVGYLLIGFAGALWMVFAGRIIAGITGGNISTAQAYIADVTSREDRAKGMGLFGAMFGLGFIFGPAIGGILSRFGLEAPFLFAAFLSFANAAALYFFLPETRSREISNEDASPNRFAQAFEAIRDPRFSLITLLYFLVITSFSIMTASFALYTIYRFGYTAEQNGYLFAYVGVVAIIMQGYVFEKLAAKFGEANLIVLGSFLLIGALVAFPFVGPEWGGLAGLLVGMAFFSVGNSLSSPALTSLASKVASEEEQGKALGVLQSGASLARAVGPVIGGILIINQAEKIDDYTLVRTFWTAAGIMFVAFLLAVYYALAGQKRFAPEEGVT